MLPSPGIFNIPSIGTPLHQPEEDLILPSAQQQQHAIGNIGHSQTPITQTSGTSVISYSSGIHSLGGPHSLMQPQTPVTNSLYFNLTYSWMTCSNIFEN